MSGAIASALTAAGVLALDGSVPDQTMTLGSFVFSDWAIPEKVTWGGAQHVIVHKLIGGDRAIDVMGPDHSDISWSGIFLAPDASIQANALDEIRKSGVVVPLIFAGRYYSVVVSQFTADQRMLAYVPYQITCTVKTDQSAVTPQFDDGPLAAVSADFIAANTILLGSPLALLPAAAVMLGVPPLLLPLPELVANTAGTTAAIAGMTAASVALNAADTTAETQIATLAAATVVTGTLAGATTAVAAIPNMQTALAATQTAAMAVVTGAYVGRALATAASV